MGEFFQDGVPGGVDGRWGGLPRGEKVVKELGLESVDEGFVGVRFAGLRGIGEVS